MEERITISVVSLRETVQKPDVKCRWVWLRGAACVAVFKAVSSSMRGFFSYPHNCLLRLLAGVRITKEGKLVGVVQANLLQRFCVYPKRCGANGFVRDWIDDRHTDLQLIGLGRFIELDI